MKISNKIKWSSLSVVVLVIGWVLLNGDKAVENVNKFICWYGSSPKLTGTWTNATEGWVDSENWHGNRYDFMELKITVNNSSVDGTITTDSIKNTFPYNFVLFKGKKKPFSDSISGEAFEVISGKEVTLGKFNLTIQNDELHVDNVSSSENLFPPKTILFKRSSTAFNENEQKSTHDNSCDKQ